MKKYLIVKLAALGDVVMAMPMVNQIKKEEPDSEITWICGKSSQSLLEQLPIDHLFIIDEKKLLTGSKMKKIQVVLDVWKEFAGKNFDVIAMGHADKRYQILTMFTKSQDKRSFSHKIGFTWPVPGRHHTDEYVRLVANHMPIKPVQAYHLAVIPDDEAVKKIIGSKTRPIITLAPGGAKNLLADDACRRWPISHYVQLAGLLVKTGYTVILSGAPGDKWILPYFDSIPVIDLVGKTSLRQLLYLFDQSDVVITHDSGPMHLAGMTKCKIIALFGPTNPWEKIPRREGVKFFWEPEKYSCCPCYDGKNYAHCNKNSCLDGIGAEKIFKEIQKITQKEES